MPPSDRYVDALGLEAYDNHVGQEFEVSELVMGAPSEIFDPWIHDVWLAGGDQVHEGVGQGYIGSVRRVPLHVEEEILSAGLPEDPFGDQSASLKIPSICYRVRKPGPFQLQSHLAMVRFIDAATIVEVANMTSKPQTPLVVWTVKTEMSSACNWLHCGGLIRLVFRMALKTFLRSLAKKAAKQTSRQSFLLAKYPINK